MESELKNSEESMAGSVGLVSETTDNKQAEDEVKGQLEMKSEFVSTVSHELRTPLTVVEGCIAAVLDGVVGRINKEQKELLDAAKRSIDTLHKLINDLFNGDQESFENSVLILDEANNFNEAFTFINTSFDWDMEDEAVQILLDLVRRKFIVNQDE